MADAVVCLRCEGDLPCEVPITTLGVCDDESSRVKYFDQHVACYRFQDKTKSKRKNLQKPALLVFQILKGKEKEIESLAKMTKDYAPWHLGSCYQEFEKNSLRTRLF